MWVRPNPTLPRFGSANSKKNYKHARHSFMKVQIATGKFGVFARIYEPLLAMPDKFKQSLFVALFYNHL